jgi:transcriptional regulator with XRE-family HTH domain
MMGGGPPMADDNAAGNNIIGPGATFGQRLQHHRERAGMSRPVLGALVGKSASWVKDLETGRRLTPRVQMLGQLAAALGVHDLADLIGEERLVVPYSKATDEHLPAVARALATYSVDRTDTPPDLRGLAARVAQSWQLWHGSRHHRTAVAVLLPELLKDARRTVRSSDGKDRRRALALQAQVYHLSQLYLSFQPKPELVTLTGDRAMTAAQDADDPVAIAAAAWYLNHVYRDAGQQHEARVELALDTAKLLAPERNEEERALFGLLHLAVALSYAKIGKEGNALRHWDQADEAAASLSDGYVHPWLMFGRSTVNAYSVTMLADLAKGDEATRRADNIDIAAIPSTTRRSFHLIETARAYSSRREHVASVTLLRKAFSEAPDTSRFNLFTRATLLELSENGGTTVRSDARKLASELKLIA